MKFFKTMKLTEVERLLKEFTVKLNRSERVAILNSLNRITSESIVSKIDIPSYDRSTVDGYAVIAKECQIASETFPTLLKISGEVVMGKIYDSPLKSGEAIYVPTGGMVPENADSVVMIEYCDKLEDEILINRGASKFQNLIKRGEEISQGETVMAKGVKITPYHIGVMASIGMREVEVDKKITFSVISTGDEIISLEDRYELGKVYDINSYAIEAYLIAEGFGVTDSKLVKDDKTALKRALEKGMEESDIVLISGGSSVGTRDFTSEVIEDMGGEVIVHGIEVKPGKPTIIAKCGGKIIIGLPGHPQSAMNVLRFVLDAIDPRERRKIYGRTLENIPGEPGKSVFINVKIIEKEKELFIEPLLSKSSMIRTLMESDGYIIIPDSCEGVYKGEVVEVILNG